jgi:hypothetical protein
MGETPDDIRRGIEQARRRLDADLNQLEYNVKSTLDWQHQFDLHPWAFCGAAFGLALLVGMATGRSAAHGND